MVTALVWLLATLAIAAQSAPAPAGAARVPAPEARPDFSGTWSIDRSLSADLSQVNFGAPGNNAPSGNSGEGRFGGFGRRGGGRPRQADRNVPGALTELERSRLKALSDEIRTSFDRLVISHHDPSFVVNDARDRTQFFQTTDSTDANRLGDVEVSSTTHWEGSRIVTTYGLSSRMKLVATYALLPKTNQMVLRLTLEDAENRRGAGAEVKLAYNLTQGK